MKGEDERAMDGGREGTNQSNRIGNGKKGQRESLRQV